ncbi:ankyrin repeat-containing protein ITN1-like [Alnus glutinosa]|uniref:ankyrin repeat-containing protein ITN1-like n=1 Tax=Alnus glutinosa TaxID=3517 RepID=UPI002D77B5BA|nr:ankyrin repeat-containing protein ITN1-like [Alnus glutinosa]
MDPSSSSKSQVFVNANKPEQNQSITFMDRNSYNAATKGKIKVFKNISDHKSLDHLLTANKNTIIHIYITALNSQFESRIPIGRSESTTNFVKEILEMCSPLLCQANVKGETPLHIAARYGHYDIVKVLIECAKTSHQDLERGIELVKEMLKMTNKEKDTALHEAVRFRHLKVVTLLIETDEYFSYSANDVGETPLYIAAERGFKDVVIEILDKCKSPIHGGGGPLGRTALHAAVTRGDKDMTTRILKKVEGISRKVDDKGWTPLHLAAYLGHSALVTLLLDDDKYVAYMKDKKGMTALHIATQRGNDDIVECIVSSCPDCCELVDNKGWNVLHFAIICPIYKLHLSRVKNNRLERIIEIIKENSCLDSLLNEKNDDGNAPLHYYLKKSWSAENFFGHPRLDKMAFNKENLTAFDRTSDYFRFFWTKETLCFEEDPSSVVPTLSLLCFLGNWSRFESLEVLLLSMVLPITVRRDFQSLPSQVTLAFMVPFPCRKGKEFRLAKHRAPLRVIKDKPTIPVNKEVSSYLRETAGAHLVVAALITTVTFAACITMPGGFMGSGEGSHPGSALLRKSATFKAFVIGK